MSNSKNILNEIYDSAYKYEKEYGFCPQAVLAALDDYFNIISPEALKSSHALSGGGALMCEGTCGALNGGYIAIGNVFGRSRNEFGKIDKMSLIFPNKLSKLLYKKFINEFGSVICKEIQNKIMGRSYNLWDPNDYKLFEEAGAHTDKCTNVAGKTAYWTAEILLNNDIELTK